MQTKFHKFRTLIGTGGQPVSLCPSCRGTGMTVIHNSGSRCWSCGGNGYVAKAGSVAGCAAS